LTESERQIYFADFVILLQAEEDDKRRRIQDARFRAEKAQRDAYREILKRLSAEGKIRPYTRWRAIEGFVKVEDACKIVMGQDQDAPMEIFEEFVDEWDDLYHRERALLSRLIDESSTVEHVVKADTSFEDFTQTLLKQAERPSDLYSDIKRIINREEPVSTARVYWEELVSKAQHAVGSHVDREESSEDEGEIIEDEASDQGETPTSGEAAVIAEQNDDIAPEVVSI
jgi:pre-mRNA-processing factor 40